jgi:hypothetical protein
MEPQQIIQQGPKKKMIGVLILLGLLVVVSGAYYFYQSHKKSNSMETVAFNDNSASVITKDFTYSPSNTLDIYAVPFQIKGSLAYKIFINNTLMDSGEPKFGSAGSIPINASLLKDGTNTLRVEVNPQPEIGTFEKNSACDVALIGTDKTAIASTVIDENENILARATCPVLFVDTEALQKEAEFQKSIVPMTKEAYDVYFAKTISKDFITGVKFAEMKTIVGPIMLTVSTSRNEVNPSIYVFTPKIPNSNIKGAVKIVITHVYSKKHKDIYDTKSAFETGDWQNVTLSDMASGYLDEANQKYAEDFYAGSRDVNVVDTQKGDYDSYNDGFTEYDGTLVVNLPLSDKGVYTKEFPFTLKAQ